MTAPLDRVIVVGAGGHATVVLDTLANLPDRCEVVGLTDQDPAKHGTRIAGSIVIGDDGAIDSLAPEEHAMIVAIGDNRLRASLFRRYSGLGFRMVNAVHPSAVIGGDVRVGRGVAIMAQGAVNFGTRLGDDVIVNTGATVDHHCDIGDHAHIAPGVRLGGHVRVGEGAQVSIGAMVVPGVTIGAWAVVGAGAVVLHNVPAEARVAGVPARPLR